MRRPIPGQKLHASLALLPGDPSHAQYLYERLLDGLARRAAGDLGNLARARSRRAGTSLEAARRPGRRRREALSRGMRAREHRFDRKAINDWKSSPPFVADHFLTAVIKNPGDYAVLIETLRPLRAALFRPLSLTFQDPARADSERSLATSILADYAADDPARLADLLMSADRSNTRPSSQSPRRRRPRSCPSSRPRSSKRASPQWGDAPLESAWAQPDPSWKGRIESAHGFLDDHFAFCQTMPLDEFLSLAEVFRKSGYRPMRFRPFADG